jgi:hypothetical protein
MTDKKEDSKEQIKDQQPAPDTVTVAGVVIKKDDQARYIYNPVLPLG